MSLSSLNQQLRGNWQKVNCLLGKQIGKMYYLKSLSLRLDQVFPGQKGRVQIKSDITDAQVKVKLHIF